MPGVTFTRDLYAAIEGADVIALVTEWPDYLAIDWRRAASLVRRRAVVDGRNCLDPADLTAHGFNYHAMGRPTKTARWDRRESDRVIATPSHVA